MLLTKQGGKRKGQSKQGTGEGGAPTTVAGQIKVILLLREVCQRPARQVYIALVASNTLGSFLQIVAFRADTISQYILYCTSRYADY